MGRLLELARGELWTRFENSVLLLPSSFPRGAPHWVISTVNPFGEPGSIDRRPPTGITVIGASRDLKWVEPSVALPVRTDGCLDADDCGCVNCTFRLARDLDQVAVFMVELDEEPDVMLLATEGGRVSRLDDAVLLISPHRVG